MMIGLHACHLVRLTPLVRFQRLFVFVCGGNTSRSPIAQAICNAEIARRLGVPLESLDRIGIKAVSAGLSAQPGEPMAAEAELALEAIGVPGFEHRSGNLTHGLAGKAEVIFCMTAEQRKQLIAAFPEAASKIHCLHADRDIDDPKGGGKEAFLSLVNLLQNLVAQRLEDLGLPETA
jgi:protein-tyrosine phosphatase